MASDADKKVEFILAWYNKERVRFSFVKQVMLAKTWIDICTKSEEYEMAAALQREKDKLIQRHLKEKKESRTWKQKARYFWVIIKRKLTR